MKKHAMLYIKKTSFRIPKFSFLATLLILLCGSLNAQLRTCTFNHTGAAQTFVVPPNVTSVTISAYGGEGSVGIGGTAPGLGGLGAESTGELAVTPGQVLNIFVGGGGSGQTGGFNGGGEGGGSFGPNQFSGTGEGGGGGGASDIRVGGTDLADRIIIAGGGGGGGSTGCNLSYKGGDGGSGGGLPGGKGVDSNSGGGGFGGALNLGGLKGIGCAGFSGLDGTDDGIGGDGQACCCNHIPSGGGGGGGFEQGGGGGGGSAGTTSCFGNAKGGGGGGGGGSSYIGGVTDGTTIDGVHAGEGLVTISYLSTPRVALCTDATIILSATSPGIATVTPADIDGGNADRECCGTLELSIIGQADFTCANVGTPTTVTLEVMDDCGSATCDAIVTVEDNTNPTAICQDITIQLEANNSVTLTAADIDNGSSDNCGFSLSIPTTSFTCDDVGATYSVVLTTEDDQGVSDDCMAMVTVADDTNPCCAAPKAICKAFTAYVQNDGTTTIYATDVNDNSTAECGLEDMTIDVSNFDCSHIGTPQNVTLTVTDINGNSDNCTTTVTVLDNINPRITRTASDETVECDGIGNTTLLNLWLDSNGGAAATDNCELNWSNNYSGFTNDCGLTGEATVRFTATDDSGNASSTTATFKIEDTQKPEFDQYPADFTMNCTDAIPTAAVISAMDICNGFAPSVDLNELIIDQQCAGTYTIQRSWTAIDDCGNAEMHTRNIFVEDNEAPIFETTPQAVTIIECTDYDTDIPESLDLILDDCDPNAYVFDITETNEYYTGNNAPVNRATKKTVREYFATDDCGNVSSVTETFYIVDRKAPTLEFCPNHVLLTVEPGADGAYITFPEPLFSDDCGYYTVTNSAMREGDWLPILETTVILITAYDGADNSTTCEFTVTAGDELVVHQIEPIQVSIPRGSGLISNVVNWNEVFARGCDECNDIENDPNFKADFNFLGELNGHRYFISKREVLANAAMTMSSGYAGYSVSINSEEENQFLNHELGIRSVRIGLNDMAQEGIFTWADGSDLVYENWSAGNPLSDITFAQSADHVELVNNGTWENVEDEESYFVLEIPCYDVFEVRSTLAPNHVAPLGDYVTDYHVIDICGNMDTTTVEVNVVSDKVEYCYPNQQKSKIVRNDSHYITGVYVENRDEVRTYRSSTENDLGYYRYQGQFAELNAGGSYHLQLTSNSSETMYYRVWIDYNADGDFYDDGEMVLEKFVYGGNVKPERFDIPNDVKTSGLSTTLMRITARKYDFPEACGEYSYGETEDYPIRIINPNSKDVGLDVKVETASSVENSTLEVFPNPAANQVFISFETATMTNQTVQITNHLGKILFEKHFETATNAPFRVNLNDYPTGVYFVSLHQEDEPILTKRLVVTNKN